MDRASWGIGFMCGAVFAVAMYTAWGLAVGLPLEWWLAVPW